MDELDAYRHRRRTAVITAVERIGEDLLGKAQRDAPVEEGTLKGSGELDIDRQANAVYAEVSFNTVYAARQHEELTWEHPKGGRAKYLETHAQAEASRYERIIGMAAASAGG